MSSLLPILIVTITMAVFVAAVEASSQIGRRFDGDRLDR